MEGLPSVLPMVEILTILSNYKFNIKFALVGESSAYANVKLYLVDSDWMKRIFSTRTNDIGCKFGKHVYWLLISISDECLAVSILTAKSSSWVDSRKSQKEDLVHIKLQFIRHSIKFFHDNKLYHRYGV